MTSKNKKHNNSSNSSAISLHRYKKKVSQTKLDNFIINAFWDKEILELFKEQFTNIYQKVLEVEKLTEVKDIVEETNELLEFYLDIFENSSLIQPILSHFFLKKASTAFMIVNRLSTKLDKNPDSIKKKIYSVLYNLEEIKLLHIIPLQQYSKNKQMRNVMCFVTNFFSTEDLNYVIEYYKKLGKNIGFNKGDIPQKEKEKIERRELCVFCKKMIDKPDQSKDCEFCNRKACYDCDFKHIGCKK